MSGAIPAERLALHHRQMREIGEAMEAGRTFPLPERLGKPAKEAALAVLRLMRGYRAQMRDCEMAADAEEAAEHRHIAERCWTTAERILERMTGA